MTETMQETASTTRYTTGFNHKLAPGVSCQRPATEPEGPGAVHKVFE